MCVHLVCANSGLIGLSKGHKNEYIPLSLYKCTLGNDCFDDVNNACSDKQLLPFKKAPSATLFTNKSLTMTKAFLACLNKTDDLGSIVTDRKTDNHMPDKVADGNTDDGHTTDEASVVVIVSDSEEQEFDYWVKIGRIQLHEFDRTEILNRAWLSSTHMAAA